MNDYKSPHSLICLVKNNMIHKFQNYAVENEMVSFTRKAHHAKQVRTLGKALSK